MQQNLNEQFEKLLDSHKKGSEERKQGVKERNELDEKLDKGLEKIFENHFQQLLKEQKKMIECLFSLLVTVKL